MELNERLALYSMTERADGPLVVPSVNDSPMLEFRVREGQVLKRWLLPDGQEYLDGASAWHPLDRRILLELCSAGSPLADWLRARGIRPEREG
jgi:hypothetical protein